MSKPITAKDILNDLLSRGETARERVRDITLPASRVRGYPFRDAGALDTFHETLRLAEQAGAISLEWRRFYEHQELERIRMRDAPALASFLDRPFLPTRVAAAFDKLDTGGLPEWMGEALGALRGSWLMGSSKYGLKIEDAPKLPALLSAVRALGTLSPETALDYRQFGARFLGDSKLTKVLAAPLAALFRQHLGVPLETREILAQLNLVPLAQPVLLCGPLRLSDGPQSVDADIRPHIGIPSGFLHSLTLLRAPAYILTIENQSSFNEYTGSFVDDGIVIYTAGFPTRALQEFYRRLAGATEAPLFHWGDTDTGGFRILKCLQEATERPILPHLMDGDHGAPYSRTQISDLKRITPINKHVDALIARLSGRGFGLVEQESMPAQPVPDNRTGSHPLRHRMQLNN